MELNRKNILICIAVIIAVLLCLYYIGTMKKPIEIRPAFDTLIEDELEAEIVETEVAEPEPKLETGKATKVYISGAVINPGVYEFEAGARVGDIVEIAGGMTEEADMDAINLATYLEDEQHIVIPKIGETVDKTENKSENKPDNGKVNINTATVDELTRLPGIGEVIANNIVTYREKNGLFKDIHDIKNVNRIGDKLFESIMDLITV